MSSPKDASEALQLCNELWLLNLQYLKPQVPFRIFDLFQTYQALTSQQPAFRAFYPLQTCSRCLEPRGTQPHTCPHLSKC